MIIKIFIEMQSHKYVRIANPGEKRFLKINWYFPAGGTGPRENL